MIDHITEMAIVTALDRSAAVVMAAVAAAEAVGQQPMVNEMSAGIVAVTTFTTTLAGRSHPVVTAKAVVGTAEEDMETAEMTVGRQPLMIGPSHCQGMIGSRRSCSLAVTGHRASTLIGTRISRSKPLALMCQTALRT